MINQSRRRNWSFSGHGRYVAVAAVDTYNTTNDAPSNSNSAPVPVSNREETNTRLQKQHQQERCQRLRRTKGYRRGESTSTILWIKTIPAFCMVYAAMQYFVLVHRSGSGDLFPRNSIYGNPIRDLSTAPMLRSTTTTTKTKTREESILEQTKRKRRTRTTPRSKTKERATSHFSFLPFLSGVGQTNNDSRNYTAAAAMDAHAQEYAHAMDFVTYPSFPTTDHIIIGDDDNICGNSSNNNDAARRYDSNDRIVIAGLFSHPVAAELALTLVKKCGVRHIIGLSDQLLTVDDSSRLEFLVRSIPGLQLEVGRGPLGTRATEDLFKIHLPSHVFYFQSESFQIPSDGGDNEGGDNDNNNEATDFKTHSGSDQLQQICNAIAKIQSSSSSSNPKKAKEQPKLKTSLLYVTSALPETNKSENSNNLAVTTALSTFHQITLDTYRMQYQLNVRELALPNIFGPFEEGAGWLLSEEFIRRAHEFMYDDENKHHRHSKRQSYAYNYTSSTMNADTDSKTVASISYNMNQPIISITDAVRSILVSGRSGRVSDEQTSVPILAATKSRTTTLLNLSKTLMPLLFTNSQNQHNDRKDQKRKTEVNKTLLPILAWQYKRYNPYQDPIDCDFSPVENDQISTQGLINTRHQLLEDSKTMNSVAISQLERRQHDIFPCITTCASYVKCTKSVWDTKISIAKQATQDCNFVLYTVDFSSTLETIPVMRESINNAPWPRDSFCQLAFVSSSSTIVKNTTQEKVNAEKHDAKGENTVEERIDVWNGKVSNNGWILVWIDEDEDSISPMDSVLPKIIPETLMHESVQFVFYLEPQHFEILPPMQLMWFLMGRQLTVAEKTKKDVSLESHKEWLIPEQHIALFSHTYKDTDVEHLDQSKPDFMVRAAKFILEQNTKINESKRNNQMQQLKNTQQLQAYANSLMWRKEEAVKFELVDTPLMIYPIDNRRGRQLRCEWYEEQLFWSNEDNANLEGLSLSYVLYRWRRQERLFPKIDDKKWGEMIMLGKNGKALPRSAAKFKTLVDKVEGRREMGPSLDPLHFVRLHSPLNARKFYEYESS